MRGVALQVAVNAAGCRRWSALCCTARIEVVRLREGDDLDRCKLADDVAHQFAARNAELQRDAAGRAKEAE